MADTKLTDLTEATDTTGAVVYGVQGGVDKKIPASLFGGGGWTVVDEVTPSAVAYIAITGLGSYRDIIIECDGIQHSGLSSTRMSIFGSQDGGSTFGKNIRGPAGAFVAKDISIYETRRFLNWGGLGLIVVGGGASGDGAAQASATTYTNPELYADEIRISWDNGEDFNATGNIKVIAK